MCLAIPGQVIEFVDEANRLAKVDVAGVRRTVNVGPARRRRRRRRSARRLGPDPRRLRPLQGRRGRGARHAASCCAGMGSEFEHELEELKASVIDERAAARRCIADFDGTASPAATTACRLRVVQRRRRARPGACAPTSTAAAQQVDVLLVAPVAPGDLLLVHAGRDRHSSGPRAVKFVDEFRDAELGGALAREILATVEPGRHYKIMEVCGGHTHSIYKYGVDDLLPANVELVHGPGCPVCVIPMGRVDDGIAIAHEPGVIFTCFGDMLRVPGADGTLLDAKAQGADVRMVYSPLDALRIAKREPRPRGRVLRHRLRDHGAVDRADAQARQGRGRPQLPRACATTSRSCRRCARCSTRPTCASTASSARATWRRSSARGPFEFIPADYGKPVVISGLRAARPAAVDPDDPAPAARRAAARSRTSTRASSPTRATCARCR